MQRVLDEVTTAFALLPVLSLMQWSHGGPGGGRGRPSPPFPDNTASATAKLDMPLYIGDITKANGILQLACVPCDMSCMTSMHACVALKMPACMLVACTVVSSDGAQCRSAVLDCVGTWSEPS